MKIAFIGVGKLGGPCALAAAYKGHDVVGYDANPAVKDIFAARKWPHQEQQAQELIAETTVRIVDTVAEAVAHSDMLLIAVPTPHGALYEGLTRMPETRADFDYTALRASVQAVAEEAKRQRKQVVIDVISTALPGTCQREVYPLLNEFTGFVYTPYFIAMGSTIPDFLKPEFTLIGFDKNVGANSHGALEMVRNFYSSIHNAPHQIMSVASAELCKVSYNVFLGLKIVAANAIMEIAHKTGANCDDVSNALAKATDRIVSPKYTFGGMGDGGGCFVEGSLIRTNMGWRFIEAIRAGEIKVLGGDNEYHEVVEAYRRPFSGEVLRITLPPQPQTRDGQVEQQKFSVTPEHPVWIQASEDPYDYRSLPAKYLRVGDRLIMPNRAEYPACNIASITPTFYTGTVYNLNVADVHSYVCLGGVVDNCHPRDQIALSWLADKLRLSYDLFGSMVKAREQQTQWLAELCLEFSNEHKLPITILGSAYKKGTNLTIGSPAILLKNILEESSVAIDQWDPHVDGPREFKTPAVFLVGTDHDEFFRDFLFPLGSVVIDPWGRMADRAGVTVVRVGRH